MTHPNEPTQEHIPDSAFGNRPLFMFCEKCKIRKDWCWLVNGIRLCLVCAIEAGRIKTLP